MLKLLVYIGIHNQTELLVQFFQLKTHYCLNY